MRLKEFIKKLKEIAEEHGDTVEVVMADNIPVVEPAFLKSFPDKKVVITDEK